MALSDGSISRSAAERPLVALAATREGATREEEEAVLMVERTDLTVLFSSSEWWLCSDGCLMTSPLE